MDVSTSTTSTSVASDNPGLKKITFFQFNNPLLFNEKIFLKKSIISILIKLTNYYN